MSIEAKHTRGPWIVIERTHPYKDGSKSHIERGIYTQRIDPQLKDHWPVVCMSVGVGMNGEKPIQFIHIDEPDAKLIAAAPDLLEALMRLIATGLDQHTHHEFMSDPTHYARAAIAKATGGEA